MLKGKKILLGITGSIAAYKIPYLVRLLVKDGADVQIIMTPSAKDFVTPLTLSTLSGNPVLSDFFNPSNGVWNSHIELGNQADMMVIAPVSACTLGKMANGIADNLLLATYLAAKCPVYFAPAMDLDMLKHPSTQNNIKKIQSFGNILIEPKAGKLASGLCGAGRMDEPENILKIIKSHFLPKQDFAKKKVLISAGPTYEAIDAVRFISNHSSGLMGYSLAEELANRGAVVKLVLGPTSLKISNPNISLINVISAEAMYKSCIENLPDADIIIMTAAVADFTPENPKKEKIKKSDSQYTLKLKPTKDILSELGRKKRNNQILIGFALETDNELENAKQKLYNKNLDFIVLNSLKDFGAGFGYKTNKITIIDKSNNINNFNKKTKTQVAKDIADKIIKISVKQ